MRACNDSHMTRQSTGPRDSVHRSRERAYPSRLLRKEEVPPREKPGRGCCTDLVLPDAPETTEERRWCVRAESTGALRAESSVRSPGGANR
jgi:hypothetical protein